MLWYQTPGWSIYEHLLPVERTAQICHQFNHEILNVGQKIVTSSDFHQRHSEPWRESGHVN